MNIIQYVLLLIGTNKSYINEKIGVIKDKLIVKDSNRSNEINKLPFYEQIKDYLLVI